MDKVVIARTLALVLTPLAMIGLARFGVESETVSKTLEGIAVIMLAVCPSILDIFKKKTDTTDAPTEEKTK